MSLYNAAGSTHVVADVAGWYGEAGATSGSRFTGVVPSRILDTRYGLGAPGRLGPARDASTSRSRARAASRPPACPRWSSTSP